MFRDPEGKKLFEMDNLASALTDVDEMKMDIQNFYGDKDASEPLYTESSTISLAAPKPRSSNMDSRSVLPTKIPPFAY